MGGSHGLLEDVGMALLSGSVKANRAAALEFTNEAVEIAKLPALEQRPRVPDLEARARQLPPVARML
jgi:hypothetical protein